MHDSASTPEHDSDEVAGESVADAFDREWRSDAASLIECFLEKAPPSARPQVLYELLRRELVHRWARGDNPTHEEYVRRFPESAKIVDRVFRSATPTMTIDSAARLEPSGERSELSADARYTGLAIHDEGGLGEVFRAKDQALQRDVAIKVIHSRLRTDSVARDRFLVESEVTGRLEHAGVVPVYACGETEDGRPFYVMRFVEGETLREAIDRYHRSGADRRSKSAQRDELKPLLRHLISAANTIDYAHNRGIVHGDLKPENIMLGKDGQALVVDWGLAHFVERDEHARSSGEPTLAPRRARETSGNSGSARGTVGYMSPEHLPGDSELSPRSDVYGLGATLYRLIAGKAAFDFSAGRMVFDRIRKGDMPRPRQVNRDVPQALEAICLKAMARRPEDRYATADAFAADLLNWMEDTPVSVYPEPVFEKLMRVARLNRVWTIAGITATASLLLLAVATTLVLKRQAQVEGRLRAQAETATTAAELGRRSNLRSTALFAASTFGHEIDQRWRILAEHAADGRLKELLRSVIETGGGGETLTRLQEWLIKRSSASVEDRKAASWFIQDADGVQLARNPWKSTIGDSYRHRSYFHGGPRDLEPGRSTATGPILRPTLSAVYKSSRTRELKVAFSVPIWDEESGPDQEPLGVLAMSVQLGDLIRLDTPIERLSVAVADLREDWLEGEPKRGLILDHPRLTEARRARREATGNDLVRLDAEQTSNLVELWERSRSARGWGDGRQDTGGIAAGSVDPAYLDPGAPVPGSSSLAAFQPVFIQGRDLQIGDVGWMVIVQDHRHGVAGQ